MTTVYWCGCVCVCVFVCEGVRFKRVCLRGAIWSIPVGFFWTNFVIGPSSISRHVHVDHIESKAGGDGKNCDHCKDDRDKKCTFCACSVCGGKQDPDKQILCDECDMAFHLWCLDPPLTDVPNDEDWCVYDYRKGRVL